MKLTDVLLRLSNHISFKHIPGNILLGKHRIWPKLTPKYKRHLLRRIDTELENMKYIARPFISQEDSKIVSEQIEKELAEKQEAIVRESIRANKNKMRDQYMSAHLDGLRNHRVWE